MADGLDVLALRRVESDRVNRVHHGVLLHIRHEQLVHCKFEKFPDDADRHRKAEGDNGHENRRKPENRPLVRVEQKHQ